MNASNEGPRHIPCPYTRTGRDIPTARHYRRTYTRAPALSPAKRSQQPRITTETAPPSVQRKIHNILHYVDRAASSSKRGINRSRRIELLLDFTAKVQSTNNNKNLENTNYLKHFIVLSPTIDDYTLEVEKDWRNKSQ